MCTCTYGVIGILEVFRDPSATARAGDRLAPLLLLDDDGLGVLEATRRRNWSLFIAWGPIGCKRESGFDMEYAATTWKLELGVSARNRMLLNLS